MLCVRAANLINPTNLLTNSTNFSALVPLSPSAILLPPATPKVNHVANHLLLPGLLGSHPRQELLPPKVKLNYVATIIYISTG